MGKAATPQAGKTQKISRRSPKKAGSKSSPASRSAHASAAYPVPGPVGGRLIRQVVSFLKKETPLPLTDYTSHILIAFSTGADSTALAQLLIRYGRRVGASDRLKLVHINHGWRAEKSDEDERFARDFAASHGVPLITQHLEPPTAETKDSWEELARNERKRIYDELARQYDAVVLTAHHQDDLAETILWRILTGTTDTHGGGIAIRHGVELRPFLTTRKKDLIAFLKEEGQSWREDETNFQGRFLRSRIRTEVMPAVERLFPRAVEHLSRLGLDAQALRSHREDMDSPSQEMAALRALFQAEGIRARRAHHEQLGLLAARATGSSGELHLPGGWKVTREISRSTELRSRKKSLRWVLEKDFEKAHSVSLLEAPKNAVENASGQTKQVRRMRQKGQGKK